MVRTPREFTSTDVGRRLVGAQPIRSARSWPLVCIWVVALTAVAVPAQAGPMKITLEGLGAGEDVW